MQQAIRLSSRMAVRLAKATRLSRGYKVAFLPRRPNGVSSCTRQHLLFSTSAISSTFPAQDYQPPLTEIEIIREGSAIQISFLHNENDSDDIGMATKSIYHAPWLWYNDPTYIHPSSGQRTRRLSQYPGWNILSVEQVGLDDAITNTNTITIPNPPPPPGCMHSIGTVYDTIHHQHTHTQKDESTREQKLLKVTWDTTADELSPVVSYYDWEWLQRCRYDHEAQEMRAQKTRITQQQALGRHPSCPKIEEVNYFDLFPTEEGGYRSAQPETLLRVLHAVAEEGAVILKDAPLGSFLNYDPDSAAIVHDEDSEWNSAVAKVGRAIGGGVLSHGALYGDLFHVRSMPKALNIAYTTVALSPHQDLAYFESKPGIQLLHCIRNHQERIRGGESVLVDAIAAAEFLRQVAPRHFNTLCSTYATFIKQREGADMVYSRPHIVLGNRGQVVAVHWSPPFEGPPLEIPESVMEDYVVAYAAFERLLDDHLFSSSSSQDSSALLPAGLDATLQQYSQDYTWERLLEPGDMLVFNNQRMLHGRRGFELLETMMDDNKDENFVNRHLAGCYANIDDTINTYRVLLRDLPDRENRMVRSFGNGSSGSL